MAEPLEDVEKVSLELLEGIQKEGGIEPEDNITLTGKQLNALALALTKGTAETFTRGLEQIQTRFKDEMKEYLLLEFQEQFQYIDDISSLRDTITKLEQRLSIHEKYLDKIVLYFKNNDIDL